MLPLLSELQDEKHPRVRKMLIHVLGQISYKKGCLEKVLNTLQQWNNKNLVEEAVEEIINVHRRYRFAYHTVEEVEQHLQRSPLAN